MATQLKTDFQPTFRPAQRPTLRVVFETNTATAAVAAAIKQMPAAIRDATLEEITIGSATEALIATARNVLSPHVYDAFLLWGAASATLAQECADADEGSERLKVVGAALQRIADAHAITLEDRNLKTWIAMVEVGDCDCFGPVEVKDTVSGYIALVGEGLVRDLATSPLCRRLDDLARSVRDASPSRAEWGHAVAQVVIDAFEGAQLMPVALPSADMFRHGEVARIVDPTDRAPLVAWQDALAQYRDASGAYNDLLAAGEYEDETHDRLYEQDSTALGRLMLTPAPSHAALAIKARVFEEREAWELTGTAPAFAADAARLAKLGAATVDDAPLVDALGTCTKAYRELAALPADHTQDDKDAIWAWEDSAIMTLLDTPATSAAGVLAKLRRGFLGLSADSWAEDALLDPTSDRFRDGLSKSDMYERMVWSAITDLARIAGVDLKAGPDATAPRDLHRTWFEVRNTLIKRLNQPIPGVLSTTESDDQMSSGCGLLNQFDNAILGTRPTTSDGLMTQLVLATQLIAEGHEIAPEIAIDLVASAERLVGMGTVSSACPSEEKA